MKKILFILIALLFSFFTLNCYSQPTIQWQKCLGGSGDDGANSIIQTNDGGYIVTGIAKSSDGEVTDNRGDYDYWVVKLDATGGIQWQQK